MMKTRLEEVGTTHGGPSHVSIGVVAIHVISLIWCRGLRRDGGGVRVCTVVTALE